MKIDTEDTQQVDYEKYEYGFSASTADQVDEILSVVTKSDDSDVVLPQDLTDVEIRLEEANCYKALLRNPLFDVGAGPIARKVEHKVREYIRLELKLLLGLEQPKPQVVVKDQFEPEELKVLKMLAAKVLNKSPVVEKRELVVNKAQLEPLPVAPKQTKPVSSPTVGVVPPVVKKGRPPQAKSKPVGENEVPKLEGPTKKEKLIIKGKLVEVDIPLQNQKQVRPMGAIQPLPPLSGDAALMHVQGMVSKTAPKSGLIGLAVQHSIKNGIEE
jgi:hypothetical protein